ncbi:MAG TPA: hypothetical protein VEU11_07225, partial [Terriglobales bacterium]|nr:hypothetical protein [Terriglobales bacterium]
MVMFRLLMTFLVPLGFRLFGAPTQTAREWYRGSQTSSWNVVQGAVHSCQMGNHNELWRVWMFYSYSARGEYWSGETRRSFARER